MAHIKQFENFHLNEKTDAEWNAETKKNQKDDAEKNPGLVDVLKEYKDAAKNLIKISKKLDKYKKGEDNGRGLVAKISATQTRANDVLNIFDNHFGNIV